MVSETSLAPATGTGTGTAMGTGTARAAGTAQATSTATSEQTVPTALPHSNVRISPLLVPNQPGPNRQPSSEAAVSATGATGVAAASAPRLRELVGICGWAAFLGGIGLLVGVRGFVGLAAGAAPGWFEPIIVPTGVIGIILTIGSFVTARHGRTPWILLCGASVSLATGMIVTTAAF